MQVLRDKIEGLHSQLALISLESSNRIRAVRGMVARGVTMCGSSTECATRMGLS